MILHTSFMVIKLLSTFFGARTPKLSNENTICQIQPFDWSFFEYEYKNIFQSFNTVRPGKEMWTRYQCELC